MDVIDCFEWMKSLAGFHIISLLTFSTPFLLTFDTYSIWIKIVGLLGSLAHPIFSIVLPWIIYFIEAKMSGCCMEQQDDYAGITVCFIFSSCCYLAATWELLMSIARTTVSRH